MDKDFKEFQNSKTFMTNAEFEEKFGTDEANGEVGVFTYGGTSLHIIINRDGFNLVVGNRDWSSKDLTELEKIFWDEFAEVEYGAFFKAKFISEN